MIPVNREINDVVERDIFMKFEEIVIIVCFMAFVVVCSSVVYNVFAGSKCKAGDVSIRVFEGEFGMLQFCLCLPKQSCHDVVSRRLTVYVDGAGPTVIDLDAGVVEYEGFEGVHGSVVSGSLVDIDAAGNESLPSEFSFTLVDTFPPPMPGQVGVKVVGQTHPEPEVPAEPEVPVEPENPLDSEPEQL